MSQLAIYIQQKQFCILVEYLSALTQVFPPKTELAGYPTVMTLADRVHSDHDISPLQASLHYPNSVDKVLHFAGKDRDIADFQHFLQQAKAANIKNLLLLSGDKLKAHHHEHEVGYARTRYLESVNAVMAARQYGGFQIAVAFNPFKYAEAERDAQYLKLHKKIKAGADLIITQLGYDIQALKQAKAFLSQHHYPQQIFACVMPLSFARARFMLKHKVAGIVITPHMLALLEAEQQAGLSDQVYLRCAIQILVCKSLGFAGVHLSGCHQPKAQQVLAHYLEQYRHLSVDALQQLWYRLWQTSSDQAFQPVISNEIKRPSRSQIKKYQQLHYMHDALFDSKIAKGIGRYIFQSSIWQHRAAAKALLKTEFFTKHGVVGCEHCGQCRLGDTLYICPETCPKGLANGPCGGTYLDRCEFGDRECIHSVKARLAKAVAQTTVLKERLIDTVPIQVRGSSSWKNWYLQTEA